MDDETGKSQITAGMQAETGAREGIETAAEAEAALESLETVINAALERRASLIAKLEAEKTDCYRIFHGIAEGRPGLNLDRYGPILLAQTWREHLGTEDLAVLKGLAERLELELAWNHRGGSNKPRYDRWFAWNPGADSPAAKPVGRELGIQYDVRPRHAGQDPLLFLDLRAGRRWVQKNAFGQRVLNLFAYTCGLGLAAAAGGAQEVWNVDFAGAPLDIGAANAELNGIDPKHFRCVHEDVYPVIRQLSGLGVAMRRNQRRRYLKVQQREFDLILLDPPKWAKSPYGAVDTVRDYPSLFKPALLATSPGGKILATNHSPKVELDDWLDVLQRCARKAERPLEDLLVIEPEADFPSFDGKPPLKMVVATVGRL